MTANGEVQTREEATVNVKQMNLFVKVMLLEETPAVLSFVKLCEDHGSHTTGSAVKNHISSEMAGDLIAMYPTLFHLWFPVYQRVLPQQHLHQLLHHLHHRIPFFDVNRYTENRVPERSGSTSEELRGDPLQESTESENQNKNRESKEVQRDISHEFA